MRWIAIRAALAVAAVYGYFLLFAQFSFVELLRGFGVGVGGEKTALGLMAAAGIAGGFFAAWRGVDSGKVRIALGVAAVTAAMAPWAAGFFPVVALATGAALGFATVGLSALLPGWCGVAWVGLGTGIGYACCNLPVVFTASPAVQAWIATGFAVVGVLAIPTDREWLVEIRSPAFHRWAAVGVFMALVWLDSAAFFIIQHSGELKAGTWGEGMLWRNAGVHLVAALVAGQWLRRSGGRGLLLAAWVILAIAALAVNGASGRALAGWWYPAGVSLYSTALVAWPGWFSGVTDKRAAAWRAAWLFAIAGWVGSANGIGMAETLQRVPVEFIVASGALVLTVLWFQGGRGWRCPLVAGVVAVTALVFPKRDVTGEAVTRGRQVYLSEGCIHCHSQYPRPGSADEELWGTAGDFSGRPVIIGNRRQGPDLRNIGARRSAAWLRIHFLDPRALAPDSTMPSYRHLFDDRRGEDLIAYLRAAGVEQTGVRMEQAATWQPSPLTSGANGAALFSHHCAACHGEDGKGGGEIGRLLARPPANLVDGPFIWTAGTSTESSLKTARVIKFGITGTDMPGHETFTDAQVNALSSQMMRLRND